MDLKVYGILILSLSKKFGVLIKFCKKIRILKCPVCDRNFEIFNLMG